MLFHLEVIVKKGVSKIIYRILDEITRAEAYLVFVVVFITAIILISPFQNAAFLDDFAYAQSVKKLLVEHQLAVSEWSDPSFVFQLFLGYLFVLIFGFSFRTLHLLNICLLFLGLTSFFYTLKLVKLGDFKSLIFTLFLFSIPWFLFFGLSFSTDIPFASLQMVFIYFFVRNLLKRNITCLVFSSVILTFSFLVRQLAIGAFIASVLILIFYPKKDKKKLAKDLIIFLLIPVLGFTAYFFWLELGNYTINQLVMKDVLKQKLITMLFLNNLSEAIKAYNLIFHRFLFYASELLGFSFLFFILLKFPIKPSGVKRIFKKFLVVLVIIVLIFSIDVLFNKERFGLYVPGVPIRYLKYEHFFPVPWPYLWKYFVISGVAIMAYLFSVRSWRNLIRSHVGEDLVVKFLLLMIIVQLFVITLAKEMYAEYLIPILPLFICFMAMCFREVNYTKLFRVQKFQVLLLFHHLSLFRRFGGYTYALLITAFFIVDMVQINKLNYQLNGLKWSEGLKLVNEGVDPRVIEIRNYAWPRWFFYEGWVENEIAKAGGKAGVKSAYYDDSERKQYLIYSDFDRIKEKGQILKTIRKKFLFVYSNVYVSKLN